MKKLISICALFCTLAIGFTACNQEKPDNPETPVADPEIKITSPEGQIIAEAAGGEYSFGYEITNPVEGGSVSVDIPATNKWITNPTIDQDTETITLTVLENPETESRDEFISVKYTYGDKSVSKLINILQREMTEDITYDYVTECTSGMSVYHGRGKISSDPTLNLYYLLVGTASLEDDPIKNSDYYYLALLNHELTDDRYPVTGTYTMVPYGQEANFTFDDFNTYAEYYGDDMLNYSDLVEYSFTEGSVDVSRDGDTYTIEAILTDLEGKTHLVRYTGELIIRDLTEGKYSTLTEDVDLDVTGFDANILNYGDYYDLGMRNYLVRLSPEDMSEGENFISLEILVPMDMDLSTDFGTLSLESYNSYEAQGPYYFVPGASNYSYSWFLTYDTYNPETGDMSLVDPLAPFSTGIIDITSNGDGTLNISTDTYCDKGFRLYIHGENLAINYIDRSDSYAAMSAR